MKGGLKMNKAMTAQSVHYGMGTEMIHKVFGNHGGRVIREQSLQVDTISGATLTSKAFLKAIENALD
jgi:major membrane immunogen (membrane-anchored lipoprotein)